MEFWSGEWERAKSCVEKELRKGVALWRESGRVVAQIDNWSISRLGKSSGESVFSDDLNPMVGNGLEEAVGLKAES